MSEAKAKRRFWQFHLITAITMMFAASGLLAYNLFPSAYVIEGGIQYSFRGWPNAGTITPTRCLVFLGDPADRSRPVPSLCSRSLDWEVSSRWLLYDALVNGAFLLSFAVVFEFLIRRREARKT